MDWLIGFGLIAFFIYYVVYILGNKKFWDIANQYPVQALKHFEERSEWYINEKPRDVNVHGPFFLVVEGTRYKIYGDADKYGKAQEDFIRSVSN